MNKYKSALILTFLLFFLTQPIKSQDKKEGQLFEYVEWSVTNSSFSGNPFDLISNVTFIHQPTNKVITTQMFYDGNNTWKFRFTGTRLGLWKYFSSSGDDELNGLEGEINIKENTDKNRYGFLTNVGNKFAIQTSENSLKGYIFNIYWNENIAGNSFNYGTEADFEKYAKEVKDNGCTVMFSNLVANSWFNFPTRSYKEGILNDPDTRTFEQLELMLKVARNENLLLHIWAWGDAESGLAQIYNNGGINGSADKRLMRYIAARLGPLAGWSLGYGFDLHEWITKSEIEEWAQYLYEHLGWQHLLSARSYKASITDLINSYESFGRETTEMHTTKFGPINYFEVLEDLNLDTLHPHLYEERHSYLRNNFDLDMDGTRRLIWWEAIAGGMGGWFGFYDCITNFNNPEYPYCNDSNYTNYYPKPEQLRTHKTFWLDKNHFLLDAKVNNNLSDGFSLSTNDLQNIVVYKEDADSINLSSVVDLSLRPIIAVDTKQKYNEINIAQSFEGKLWVAPYKSDWAIAIGNFEGKQIIVPIDTTIILDTTITKNSLKIDFFNATQSFSIVIFSWATSKENNITIYELEKSIDQNNWNGINNFQPNNDIDNFHNYSFSEKISDANLNNFYRLKVTFTNNEIRYSEIISPEKTIEQIELLQNYPNPFNGDATIEFSLPNDIITNITVYNSIGEKIQTLVNGKLSSGYHKVFFKANNLPSGVYVYTLKAGYFFTQKKMILLK